MDNLQLDTINNKIKYPYITFSVRAHKIVQLYEKKQREKGGKYGHFTYTIPLYYISSRNTNERSNGPSLIITYIFMPQKSPAIPLSLILVSYSVYFLGGGGNFSSPTFIVFSCCNKVLHDEERQVTKPTFPLQSCRSRTLLNQLMYSVGITDETMYVDEEYSMYRYQKAKGIFSITI